MVIENVRLEEKSGGKSGRWRRSDFPRRMNPLYRQTAFLTSAAKLSQTPPDTGFEVAFAGRSNAGKSSAINAL